MGRKQKKNEAQIAALNAKINWLQSEFELFLENSSCTQNPENHEKILKDYVQKIMELKGQVKKLSK